MVNLPVQNIQFANTNCFLATLVVRLQERIVFSLAERRYFMTANQIAYVKAQEEQRTNRAKEQETYRTNTAQEAERRRANDLNYNASIYASQVNEANSIRAANAQTYAAQLNYTSNMAATEVRRQEAKEQARHNTISELQTDFENRTRSNIGMSNILNNVVGAGATGIGALVTMGKFLVP